MLPTRPVTIARRLTVVVVAAVLVLVGVALLGADRLGILDATALETAGPARASTDPALAGLDPVLADRFVAAREAAAAAGYPLVVTSGARTAAEQQRLLDEAVAEHGSPEAAGRWVLPPEQSAHVQGRAIDVGPAEGRGWLAEHGAEFGLCQVYVNEPWHFEPLVAPGETCPALAPDASRLVTG